MSVGHGECALASRNTEDHNLRESARKLFDKNDEAGRVDSAGCVTRTFPVCIPSRHRITRFYPDYLFLSSRLLFHIYEYIL